MSRLLRHLHRNLLAILALSMVTAYGRAELLRIEVQNLSPNGGLFMTPFWVGFHSGAFDIYDNGAQASLGLERIAEDGDVGQLRTEFAAADPMGQDGVVIAPAGFPGAPVFDPGDSGSLVLNVNPMTQRYFSYASMIIPSNDAFVANGNPMANQLFDALGNFLGTTTIDILGVNVLDAGTEENTEMDAAFFDQMAPNTGITTQNGTVGLHPGFIGSLANPGGTRIILGGTSIAPPGFVFDEVLADFTQPGVVLGRITITRVPEPTSFALLMVAGVLGLRRRMRS